MGTGSISKLGKEDLIEKTASLRLVLLDRDAHPAPTCPDSRSAQSLCALLSHFCRCSFCLEARDGPSPGGGHSSFGGHRTGGRQGRVWKGRGGMCAWKWWGTHPSKTPVWDIHRAVSRPASLSHLQPSMQSLRSWWPLASSLQDLGP